MISGLRGGTKQGNYRSISGRLHTDVPGIHIRTRSQVIECPKGIVSLHTRHILPNQQGSHRGLPLSAVAVFSPRRSTFAPPAKIGNHDDLIIADQKLGFTAGGSCSSFSTHIQKQRSSSFSTRIRRNKQEGRNRN